MLPIPIIHSFVNCSGRSEGNYTFEEAEVELPCANLSLQYQTFLILSCTFLLLLVLGQLLQRKERLNHNMVLLMSLLIKIEVGMTLSLAFESIFFLKYDLCRQFPNMPYGIVFSSFFGVVQLASSSLLIIRNWTIAMMAYLRYMLISRKTHNKDYSSHIRTGMITISVIMTALSVLRLCGTKGTACQGNFFSGSVTIEPLRSETLVRIIDVFVFYPLQGIVPVTSCVITTYKTIKLLHEATVSRQRMNHDCPIANHRGSVRAGFAKPSVILFMVNIVFILAEVPVVLYRIASYVNDAISRFFWLPNVLVVFDSLSNGVVYLLLMKQPRLRNLACLVSGQIENLQTSSEEAEEDLVMNDTEDDMIIMDVFRVRNHRSYSQPEFGTTTSSMVEYRMSEPGYQLTRLSNS